MYYVIWSSDAENAWEARKATRPAHLERVQALADEGRVLIAGPMPKVESADMTEIDAAGGMSGSMIVAEFDSLQAAEAWANADPYVAAGVYEKVEVRPYLKVLP